MCNTIITNEKDDWSYYVDKNLHYSSLYDESFKKQRKTIHSHYDIYNYGIKYYSCQLSKAKYGSNSYVKIKQKMDRLYNKHYQLLNSHKKIEFETDIYWELSQLYLDKMNYYLKKSEEKDNCYITKKNSPIKKITKVKKDKVEKEICSICLDTHKVKDLVVLHCSHIFGKICFQKILATNDEKTTCPLCRSNCRKISLLRVK